MHNWKTTHWKNLIKFLKKNDKGLSVQDIKTKNFINWDIIWVLNDKTKTIYTIKLIKENWKYFIKPFSKNFWQIERQIVNNWVMCDNIADAKQNLWKVLIKLWLKLEKEKFKIDDNIILESFDTIEDLEDSKPNSSFCTETTLDKFNDWLLEAINKIDKNSWLSFLSKILKLKQLHLNAIEKSLLITNKAKMQKMKKQKRCEILERKINQKIHTYKLLRKTEEILKDKQLFSPKIKLTNGNKDFLSKVLDLEKILLEKIENNEKNSTTVQKIEQQLNDFYDYKELLNDKTFLNSIDTLETSKVMEILKTNWFLLKAQLDDYINWIVKNMPVSEEVIKKTNTLSKLFHNFWILFSNNKWTKKPFMYKILIDWYWNDHWNQSFLVDSVKDWIKMIEQLHNKKTWFWNLGMIEKINLTSWGAFPFWELTTIVYSNSKISQIINESFKYWIQDISYKLPWINKYLNISKEKYKDLSKKDLEDFILNRIKEIYKESKIDFHLI